MKSIELKLKPILGGGYDVKLGRRILAKVRRTSAAQISCSINGLIWFFTTMEECMEHLEDFFGNYFQFLSDHVIFCKVK